MEEQVVSMGDLFRLFKKEEWQIEKEIKLKSKRVLCRVKIGEWDDKLSKGGEIHINIFKNIYDKILSGEYKAYKEYKEAFPIIVKDKRGNVVELLK